MKSLRKSSLISTSALVGMLVMVISFPLPGYVAKIIQSAQIERMKKVCLVLRLFTRLNKVPFLQTDARVQVVSESGFISLTMNLYLLSEE